VLLHRQAAAWNDKQIITHFRNALKKVIDWFDSLPAFNVSQHVWQEIQTRFEIDYKAKATATSIVAKLQKVRQAADETVNNYLSRANKILWELKSNIDDSCATSGFGTTMEGVIRTDSNHGHKPRQNTHSFK
jgi:hypothetical protein